MSVAEKTIDWNLKVTTAVLLKTVINQNKDVQLHELTSLASPSHLATLYCFVGFFNSHFFLIIPTYFHLVTGNDGMIPPVILSCLFSKHLLFWMDDLSISENTCF